MNTAVASFSWLDHREEDAERVREALAAFDQPGMIDPLGFGVVRDAFSDLLFPGVSTVQTRARYFLFVPWIYQGLDEEGISSSEGSAVAREWEYDLIEATIDGSEDLRGVIGQFSRRSTSQLPSQIYWGGLGRWGIRRFHGSRRDYVASLDRRRARRSGRDHDPASTGAARWASLPDEPVDLLESCSLDLTDDEADFLRTRILGSVSDTYLALLARDGTEGALGTAPWSGQLVDEAPLDLSEQLRHARLFSLVAWGANLLYNDLLDHSYLDDGDEGFDGRPAELLAAWQAEMDAEGAEVDRWAADRKEFWSLVLSVNPRATRVKRFVDGWLEAATSDPIGVVNDRTVHQRIREREAAMKTSRARLSSSHARETSSGMQGEDRMYFRWSQARDIVDDIHRGLS